MSAMKVTLVCAALIGAVCALPSESDLMRGIAMLTTDPAYHAPIISAPVGTPILSSDGGLPAVIVHGMGDAGTNPGMKSICATVGKKYPGKFTLCSTTADSAASITERMMDQLQEFTKEVRSHPELAKGFNAVGLSQGNVLLQGYIGLVNDPPVRNFVSICGPLQGIGTCPDGLAFKLMCPIWRLDPYGYGSFSGYWKDVSNQQKYLSKSNFNAIVLNERDDKNATIAENFKSLQALVLVEALQDSIVVPRESEQQGFWDWGKPKGAIVAMRDSAGYKGDWIGLKTLDEASRIKMSSFEGEHIRFNSSYWENDVLPYLA